MSTVTTIYPETASQPCPECALDGITRYGSVVGDDQWTHELVFQCPKHGLYIVPHTYPDLVEEAPASTTNQT